MLTSSNVEYLYNGRGCLLTKHQMHYRYLSCWCPMVDSAGFNWDLRYWKCGGLFDLWNLGSSIYCTSVFSIWSCDVCLRIELGFCDIVDPFVDNLDEDSRSSDPKMGQVRETRFNPEVFRAYHCSNVVLDGNNILCNDPLFVKRCTTILHCNPKRCCGIINQILHGKTKFQIEFWFFGEGKMLMDHRWMYRLEVRPGLW